MIEPPSIAVVPELAFCTRVVAATALEKVVMPVLVNDTFPKPRDPPTSPVNVISPLPAETVRLLLSPIAESTVFAKRTTPLALVVKPTWSSNTTASPNR